MCEHERASLNLMKLENPVTRLPNKDVIDCVRQQEASPKRLPSASAVNKLLSPICKKPAITVPSPQPANHSLLKQKECCPTISDPLVSAVRNIADEDLHSDGMLGSRELPIISSVFSLRSSSEGLDPCVSWASTKESELQCQPMSLPVENPVVLESLSPADQDQGIDQNSLNHSSSLNIENKKNLVGADERLGSRGNAQDCQPVFIPQGSVLKVSNSTGQPLSGLQTAKESLSAEGNWLPRPVLSSGVNEQNGPEVNAVLQSTGLKLSLKRRRSGAENEGYWKQQELTFDRQDNTWKLSKHKKKRKKHKKAFNTKAFLPEVTHRDETNRWLTPLRTDQLVHFPSPNQPVVVLNHPRPHASGMTSDVYRFKVRKHNCSTDSCSIQQVPCEAVQTQCLLKIKLKKVNKKRYKVVGFIYRDIATKS
ncbi:zinc finger protein 518B isoform X2 [Scleropages formosus]|nr:zinc finger protein 518B isoform X2 [Scleropages formosus]XP_018590869.1 zinc finger protein 518B isoform X2 [Scleropages formosus]